MFRHIFSNIGAPGGYEDSYNLFDDSFITHTLDDISYIHWSGWTGSDVGEGYNGINYNEISGYSIDTSRGGGVCSPSDDILPLWQFSFDNLLS